MGEHSLLSRIQVLEAPMAAPGHCAICGTSQGPVIDFGMFMEFYGVVYLCVENCMVELANSFDYHSPRQWKLAMDQVADQRQEINSLRDQNEQLRSTIISFNELSRLTHIDRTSEFDVDSLPANPSPRIPVDPEQLSFDFTDGEDAASKQDDEQRLTDVHHDDDDFESYFNNL